MKRQFSLLLVLCVWVGGCASFPKTPAVQNDNQVRRWKTTPDDPSDYFQYLDDNGRIVGLGFDDDGDGAADCKVDLLTVCEDGSCPHYVIALDGIPFHLLQQLYDEGLFRLFHRPAKVVSTFPSMTDLAFSQLFGSDLPYGFEALWYERDRDRVVGGNMAYLAEKNAPWQKMVGYRVNMVYDAVGYAVGPGWLFRQELSGIEALFNRTKTGTAVGYSVGAATVGTRQGEAGIIKCLRRTDHLCEKLMFENRGRCHITVLADHGHNLKASEYFQMSKALKSLGFNATSKLAAPNDVICIEFGLVTYSAMYTDHPAKLADALVTLPQVNLVMYRDRTNDTIVVRNAADSARISRTQTGYTYRTETGDPLELNAIVARLTAEGKVAQDGSIDDAALLQATADHVYPDALARIYQAFYGLAKHPPDLVATIRDGRFCGASNLAGSVDVASTHGSLNAINSVTFVMSTIRPIDRTVQISELKDILPEIIPVGAAKGR